MYYAEGDLDCAEEELERALAIDPHNALALEQREQVRKARGDQDE
jgi:Tfp pilus assembly protein PilF